MHALPYIHKNEIIITACLKETLNLHKKTKRGKKIENDIKQE